MEVTIKGHRVLFDKEDFNLVSQYRWYINDSGYAVWRGIKDGKKQTIRMHRLIMNAPSDKVIDHINHNKLDNRKTNLRICTQSENMLNLKNQGRGYWFQKQNNNWVVELSGKHIGVFASELEAKNVVNLIRSGGVYVKPKRTHCSRGHSLHDAYNYNGRKLCRICQSIRSKAYFKRKYVPKPRKQVTVCPRGHNKLLTRTKKGDCSLCINIRRKEWRERKAVLKTEI